MTVQEAIKLLTDYPTADALARVEAEYQINEVWERAGMRGQDIIGLTDLAMLMMKVRTQVDASTPLTAEQLKEREAKWALFSV